MTSLELYRILRKDFDKPYEKMLLKLLSKDEKYGLSYQANTNVDYYLGRLKEEIEEFERNPSLGEALDVANFGLMMVYHLLNKEVLS